VNLFADVEDGFHSVMRVSVWMTTGAKAQLIHEDLRGPEGPLFHGGANILDFSGRLGGGEQM
jgi:hypothetical protein